MIKIVYNKIIFISIIFLFIVTLFSPLTFPKTINQKYENFSNTFRGYILYTPEYSTHTYLIDNNGSVVHSWDSDYLQGMGVYLLDNGDLVRSCLPYINPTFWGGGITGRVEKYNWAGSLLWEFEYSNQQHCLHHDVEPLPNGNILMIAWEYKTKEEAINAGLNPSMILFDYVWPDKIIEVEPTGPATGEIVWEWHVWDHLIQDFDPTKDNYGVVADHPELIDINFPIRILMGDWQHVNSVDYEEEFDQILISARGQSEIWVIDHSTTTKEAAGHTGGNYGKGGDILYRWGNPKAYRAGTTDDQKFFDQHDARWIEAGYLGEGNIMVFCNGKHRPGLEYSSIDEIVPPIDSNGNYYLESGSAYGPEEQIWRYTAPNPEDFYATYLSGVQRLYSGNTLICVGDTGTFFEVTPDKEIVWEYVNPYPTPLTNEVFTVRHYPPEDPADADLFCEGNLNWKDVKTGEKINGSFQVQNIGDSDSLLNWEVTSFPNWGTWSFNPESGKFLSPNDGNITVNVSVIAPDKKNRKFDGTLRIENQKNSKDYEIIQIYLDTPRSSEFKLFLDNFLFRYLESFPILKRVFEIFSMYN
jgi:hypothetical protein